LYFDEVELLSIDAGLNDKRKYAESDLQWLIDTAAIRDREQSQTRALLPRIPPHQQIPH
jgi:hypothetical protein